MTLKIQITFVVILHTIDKRFGLALYHYEFLGLVRPKNKNFKRFTIIFYSPSLSTLYSHSNTEHSLKCVGSTFNSPLKLFIILKFLSFKGWLKIMLIFSRNGYI